jgi:hypothetical protein
VQGVELRKAPEKFYDLGRRSTLHFDHHNRPYCPVVIVLTYADRKSQRRPGLQQSIETRLNRPSRDAQYGGKLGEGRSSVLAKDGNQPVIEVVEYVHIKLYNATKHYARFFANNVAFFEFQVR